MKETIIEKFKIDDKQQTTTNATWWQKLICPFRLYVDYDHSGIIMQVK